MIRVLHLLDRDADFQAERGADALTRGLGAGYSSESRRIGRGGNRNIVHAVLALRRDVDRPDGGESARPRPAPRGATPGGGRKTEKKARTPQSHRIRSFLAKPSRMAPNMAHFGSVKKKLHLFVGKYVEKKKNLTY